MSVVIDKLRAARRVSVPIVAIQSSDLMQTVRQIHEAPEMNGCPRIQWDCVRGATALNDAGTSALSYLDQDYCATPAGMLSEARKLPPDCILFYHNAHRFMDDVGVMQAMCNLRDEFKRDRRTLVLLGIQLQLPLEIRGDVYAVDEPLPVGNQIHGIIGGVIDDAGLDGVGIDGELIEQASQATRGLTAYQIEQLTALSLRRDGLDVDALWSAKRAQVNQTRGLSIFTDGIGFDSLGGLSQVKKAISQCLNGRRKFGAIVWLDEGDDAMAGQNDMTGIGRKNQAALLSHMENRKASGFVMYGHPGSGKSAISAATAVEAGLPCIQVDLGAMLGSLVGESEAAMRAALQVIDAISGGSALWMMTSNSLDNVSPQLLARFREGVWFYELPSADERDAIWRIHSAKHGVQYDGLESLGFDDADWVGRDIRNCCEKAWNNDVTIAQAAEFINPIAKACPRDIERRRDDANGRYFDASRKGVYRKTTTRDSGVRKISLD